MTKVIIKKAIRQLDDTTFWVGVRDKFINHAIENKELLEIEIKNIGIGIVNPKIIKKSYKPEPFVGLFPNEPMMFYYFPIKLLSPAKEEELENYSLIMALK